MCLTIFECEMVVPNLYFMCTLVIKFLRGLYSKTKHKVMNMK